MLSLFRTKPIQATVQETTEEKHRLKRSLRARDLTALGIGCIIGVGIFVLPGVEAANHAGPAIILSLILAALAAGCSALSYAELASVVPVSGSAYTYGYVAFGEIVAWIIGWDLILEYMVGAMLVAIGWAGYFTNLGNHLLQPLGLTIPHALSAPPWGAHPGIINLPAALIIGLITWLLVRGIKESSQVNLGIVAVKLSAILLFIAAAAWHINPKHWQPFMPFGFSGVATASAILFMAYAGFDCVSTTAEEAVNPQRDMPIGILGSLLVSTILYLAVAAVLTGVISYTKLSVADPIAVALNAIGMPWVSSLVSLGATIGITSVLLVLLVGQPRIFFSMSRDGLLPERLAAVHQRYRTPYLTTIITGALTTVGASLLPIHLVAELSAIGTLFAFVIVSLGVILLRYTRPDIHRTFKVPFFPFTPALGVILCGYLMVNLPAATWIRFVIWLAIGLVIYFAYGYRHSRLAHSTSR
ncbi:MAG: amino acid permease [Deltaproteobacteria bacterium]|nr:amino acid permease [Deltaproteobacteria bacterium]